VPRLRTANLAGGRPSTYGLLRRFAKANAKHLPASQ
jgi:hypothetical protein